MSSTKHAGQMDQYYQRKWEGRAGYWFDHYPPSAQVYALSLMKVRNATIAAIVPNSVTKILDIGCGVGDILRELSPKTASIVGIDISSVNVRLARENLSNDGV